VIHTTWTTTLNKRFFYTKELLLGVGLAYVSTKTTYSAERKTYPPLGTLSPSRSQGASGFARPKPWLLFLVLISLVFYLSWSQLGQNLIPANNGRILFQAADLPVKGVKEIDPEAQADAGFLPAQDPSLPLGDWLIIPQVGIETQFKVSVDPTEALTSGVWLEPNYGQPGKDDSLPIIMAAHRFGWNWWWQSGYWKKNSFYLLPEVNEGTIVEVISNQRKWVYKIVAKEEGEEISSYNTDLILYTCKQLGSATRYIRYGELVKI